MSNDLDELTRKLLEPHPDLAAIADCIGKLRLEVTAPSHNNDYIVSFYADSLPVKYCGGIYTNKSCTRWLTTLFDGAPKLLAAVLSLLQQVHDLRADRLDGLPVYVLTEFIPWFIPRNEGEGDILGVYLDKDAAIQARDEHTKRVGKDNRVFLTTFRNGKYEKAE